MAVETKIEWTDHTFNPWIGCTKVHAGCTHCYAESYANRYGKAKWGPSGTRAKTSESYWKQPLKWNRDAEKAGERRRVFCASLADVFEDWRGPIQAHDGDEIRKCVNSGCRWRGLLPVVTRQFGPQRQLNDCPECGCPTEPATMNDLRSDLFALIDATPNLDWLLLTKRPENVRRMWPIEAAGYSAPPIPTLPPLPVYKRLHRPNVWIGTSISDQATADEWIPRLLELRDLSPVLFLSAEPLLGPIDLGRLVFRGNGYSSPQWQAAVLQRRSIDWVIVGGESGHGARPCNVEWIRSLIEQCLAAEVPCFVKQLGAGSHGFSIHELPHGMSSFVHSKGGDIDEWPKDLRIREFPHGR